MSHYPKLKSITGAYRVYTALLTQSGLGNPPVPTILQNTLGGVPAWGYAGVGYYTLTLSSAFTGNVFVSITNGVNNVETIPFVYECQKLNSNVIFLSTKKSTNGGMEDDSLTNASIEIRVYF